MAGVASRAAGVGARMSDAGAARPAPPPDTDDVASLVRRAQRGEVEAYGALYERFARYLHGVALAHAPPDEARDLVQDTFLHGLSRLAMLRDPSAFGAWMAQITRNMARMKRRKRLTLVDLDDQLPDEREPSTEAALDGGAVLAAIRALPEAYREPLVLRLVEGMSGEEIAARTGLTHGSVRVNLHRGMALLRQKLGGAP